jgi:GTP-binding protein EngB required for normal cell division
MIPKIRNNTQEMIFNGRSNASAAISANINAQVLCITSKMVFINIKI